MKIHLCIYNDGGDIAQRFEFGTMSEAMSAATWAEQEYGQGAVRVYITDSGTEPYETMYAGYAFVWDVTFTELAERRDPFSCQASTVTPDSFSD